MRICHGIIILNSHPICFFHNFINNILREIGVLATKTDQVILSLDLRLEIFPHVCIDSLDSNLECLIELFFKLTALVVYIAGGVEDIYVMT